MVTDREYIIIAIEWKYNMLFRLAFLHFAVAHCKGQGHTRAVHAVKLFLLLSS